MYRRRLFKMLKARRCVSFSTNLSGTAEYSSLALRIINNVFISMQAISLDKVDTEYSADCIEWCPFEPFRDLFVCGTYQVLEPNSTLQPTENVKEKAVDDLDDDDHDDEGIETISTPKQTQRTGRLLLFQVNPNSGKVKELQRIDTPAILDAKWSPHLGAGESATLVVADAKGHLTVYTLDPDTRQLHSRQTIDVDQETILCLSLDFSHRLHSAIRPNIITSLSNGSLLYLSPTSTGEYEITQSWHSHDFEPWCATWDNWDLNTVWSGGDDLKLKRWDVRDTSMPTMTNKRFEAGVTTITSSPYTQHLLAVGSYDESLRLFDARSPLRPLRTIPLGGGIWRARFHPDCSRSNEMLIASMHDGFKIVKLDSEDVRLLPALMGMIVWHMAQIGPDYQ